MNKRGIEMATSTIIMVLIGLIVLAIIVVVFRQQVTKGSQGYQEYTGQTSPGALDKCQNFILGRKCLPAADCTVANKLQRASGVFPECTADNGKVCCESS